MTMQRHITLPGGFVAAGVTCGIKTGGNEDLAIFSASRDVPTAVMTTRNQVVGAPVLWCRKVLPRGHGKARAMVINSGVSNVCTAERGLRDAETMASLTAERLGCDARKVLVASTGVIGHFLPMDKVRKGIAKATGELGTKRDRFALRAIMTTDTREKFAVVRGKLAGKDVAVAGIVKGAGMIAPSMATMLCVLTTDAAVTPAALHKALKQAVEPTLNAVTIDSDTSTSDTTAIFASGEAGSRPITTRSPDFKRFAAMLADACRQLARQMASDGEGATRLIEIAVRGARSHSDAAVAARSVANSPLLKCAVNGADPNWGRVVMALGKSSAKVVPDKLSVRIVGTLVFKGGRPRKFDPAAVSRKLRAKEVKIECDLGLGKGEFTTLTCDLSREYVTINADYHT